MPFSLPVFSIPKSTGSNSVQTGARSPTTLGGASRSVYGQPTRQAGVRGGQAPNAAVNAGSEVRVIIGQLASGFGAGITQPISIDGDFVAMVVTITVTVTSASATVDVLGAIGSLEIDDPNGVAILMTPSVDFYMWQQRFGQYGIAPAKTTIASATTTGTASATATYYVSGFNLPQAAGSYTLILTNAASWNASSSLGVTYTVNLVRGNCGGYETHYKTTTFAPPPAASAEIDYASVAAIKGVPLEEIFISGMTSNTADIATMIIESAGNPVATKISSASILGRDNSVLSDSNGAGGAALSGTVLYLCLALGTRIILGLDAHLYVTFGGSPNSAMRFGYYWLVKVS